MRVVYEAGPTGFGLARFLLAAEIECVVAAPSKLQRPAGDRVKTDARDALHLARLLHLGEITPVTVPSVEQEAARDLVRAREDVRGDLMSARHRLSKLLLRQGIVYSGGKAWTGVHDTWLRQQRFELLGLQMAYDTAYETMLATVARRERLDKAIAVMAADSPFTPVVNRLGCLRGVSTLTAFGLAVEIGDWQRLTGRSIGAYLGMVPTEHSSGQSRSQGGLTKTGNGHARRLLIEAAWHHRHALPGTRCRSSSALGTGAGQLPLPRACRQPPPARALAELPRPQEDPGDRQRRDRPRTGRLVLVAGRPRHLTAGRPGHKRPSGHPWWRRQREE